MKCTGHRTNGDPCQSYAINGTDRCTKHSGRAKKDHIARGQVVMELRNWGLNHETVRDPGQTLLQLMTQSAMRAEFYAGLLGQAYEAAERLREHTQLTVRDVPGQQGSKVDAERASEDLERIFSQGGVASLIGVKWSSSGGEFGGVFAAEEAIRGLVQLEAAERDRCAGMATKAIAAGLAERQVRLAEQQGALVADAIRGMLTALGHDPSDPTVMHVVSTQLRALTGGAA